MTFLEIQTKTLDVILRCRGFDIPSERLDDMASLVRAGEPGIALENLCSNLDDFEVRVPTDVLEDIEVLGQAMGLNKKWWVRLEPREGYRWLLGLALGLTVPETLLATADEVIQ